MRIWTTLALLAAIAGGIWATVPAEAYNCTTTCSGSGSFRSCNTSCF